jgi:hypothetical protein
MLTLIAVWALVGLLGFTVELFAFGRASSRHNRKGWSAGRAVLTLGVWLAFAPVLGAAVALLVLIRLPRIVGFVAGCIASEYRAGFRAGLSR